MELELIFMGASCVVFGGIFTFGLVLVCGYFSIDIFKNIWLLGIPAVLSVGLNILLLEIYRKYKDKRKTTHLR
jgi:hypothetical protein